MLSLGLVQELWFLFVGLHSGKVIERILDVNLAGTCFLKVFIYKYCCLQEGFAMLGFF